MSDYSKSTNFTTKDTLPTGNSGKIVKGTELDTEFVAIASAIASKADISSPDLLGTPTTTTATAGSNTTQIANTAFVKAAIDTLALGNMSTQAKSAVDITGGTIVGITDLAVADGGTGASSLTGVVIGNGTSAMTAVAPGTSGNVLKSNGSAWTSAAPTPIAGLGLNGETWHDVTGSRGLNATYTNSRSYPIQLGISIFLYSGGGFTINVNGVTVGQDTSLASTRSSFYPIVPPGGTYSVNGGGNLNYWAELY